VLARRPPKLAVALAMPTTTALLRRGYRDLIWCWVKGVDGP